MEYQNSIHHLIGLIDRPAFCVKDGIIRFANTAARNLGIVEKLPIADLLGNSTDRYNEFNEGALSCSLQILGTVMTATVNRVDGMDYFVLNEAQDPAFNSLAQASQQLRKPLANIIALMDSAYMQTAAGTAEGETPIKQLNKSLMQLHRQICNMSDASLYTESAAPMSVVGIRGLFLQIMDKASALLQDFKLMHTEPEQETYTLACGFLLERAIYNLISNAVKFAPKGSEIHAKLEKVNGLIYLSIQSETTLTNPRLSFYMYKRAPSLEDGRLGMGMGLGMVIVNKAASIHNGTVLMDQPTPNSIRVTITLQVNDDETLTLHSYPSQYVDYSGGVDHALLELSDILSKDFF